MYRNYWGLQHKPFQEHHDASFCYRHDAFQAAQLKMRYVLENRLGVGVLVGEAGCGKTFLLRMLVTSLPDEFGPFVRVAFPQLNSRELLGYFASNIVSAEERAASPTVEESLDRILNALQDSLRQHTQNGRQPVLLIDDAHVIDKPVVFEALQLLLNLREPGRRDFALILCGEPQLLPRLLRHPSLAGRIPIRTTVFPLTSEETAEYVEHRLRIAGAKREIFEPPALRSVFELTGGVPLQINHLCELSLLVGYADRTQTINAEQVLTVAEELPLLAGRVPQAA